jgi:hypothetical protein
MHDVIADRPGDYVGYEHPADKFLGHHQDDSGNRGAQNLSYADLLGPLFCGKGSCFVSAKFGQLVIFLKLWFAYNKTKQGDNHEFQKIYST